MNKEIRSGLSIQSVNWMKEDTYGWSILKLKRQGTLEKTY